MSWLTLGKIPYPRVQKAAQASACWIALTTTTSKHFSKQHSLALSSPKHILVQSANAKHVVNFSARCSEQKTKCIRRAVEQVRSFKQQLAGPQLVNNQISKRDGRPIP